jgi:phytoene synthase
MAAPRTLPPAGALEASYRRCRALAKRHGTTYYLSTFLLPRKAWPHVWALYAFCRCADEIVDDMGAVPVAERERALRALGDRFFVDLAAGNSDDPVLRAVVATVGTYRIDPECFRRFLASMAMDLTVASYATWDDLLGYMDGSAAVIGEMMLPILDPPGRAEAVGPARDLGLAFQLTNFLRDVGEDLDRGRVYLPQEDLDRFGADPATRRVDGAWRRLMAFEIDRCRDLYRSADAGLALLPPASARCVGSARVLYAGILDRIEAAGYDVFTRRARVPGWRKLTTVARALAAGPPGDRPSPTGRSRG